MQLTMRVGWTIATALPLPVLLTVVVRDSVWVWAPSLAIVWVWLLALDQLKTTSVVALRLPPLIAPATVFEPAAWLWSPPA